MNKVLKFIIVLINLGMLYLAYEWYLKTNEYEPKIVILGQILAVLGLLFEQKVTEVFTKNIDNSEVKIERKSTDSIHTENVKDSTIDIK